MPVPQTDLRDDLVALIAAGRELSPEHDEALAGIFIDHHLARPRSSPVVPRRRKVGGLLAVACLGLAGLGAGSVLAVGHSGASAEAHPKVIMPAQWKMQFRPLSPKMQFGVPSPKVRAVPVPKVRAVPIAPQFPSAPTP